MTNSLLPPNATAQEIALEQTVSRISTIPLPIREIWNPTTCPSELLPWLAWAFGVDEWDDGWPEAVKRDTIRYAVSIQRKKGSVWSIKRVIAAAGFGDSELLEGNSEHFYNATYKHDGLITHGDLSEWASYRFILMRPINNTQAAQIRRLLESTVPARCHLVAMIFTAVANIYNGTISYDGNFNYGAA